MGMPGCVGTGLIPPELREGPLGCGSNASVGHGTGAGQGSCSGCEIGCAGLGSPSGQGVVKLVGPRLLTEKPDAKGWEN